MDSSTVASLVIAVATGLLGLAVGRGWAHLRSAGARRRRAGSLSALQARLGEQKMRADQLEADLHAQQARNFELERELEARESDWAQSSPTPFSFDARTFEIDRSLRAEDIAHAHDAERIADLERQVRDLQDLLSKVSSRSRPARTRANAPYVTAIAPGHDQPRRAEPPEASAKADQHGSVRVDPTPPTGPVDTDTRAEV